MTGWCWCWGGSWGSAGCPLAPSWGDPDRELLRLIRSLAATPPFGRCGGDCMPSGMGGGGGRLSRPVDILRPRVGVLAFDAFGVPPPLPVEGGAGGGCDGRDFDRDGVPGAYRLSWDIWLELAVPYMGWPLYSS
uniref:(northern house mosquito) hypothetical protein n=1 Tax=Culex pipiens TaxID=7175 RepID=A0A8D8N5Z2_CULPI